LLNLPKEVLTALQEGKIAYTKAGAIAKVKDEEKRKELLAVAISEGLSLSEIKERIALLKEGKKEEIESPQNRVKSLSKQLTQSKLWQSQPKTWKKVQSYLDKIEALLKSEES
jgi:ParB family chromosome partitioning protein